VDTILFFEQTDRLTQMESEARYAWVGAMVVVLFLVLAGSLYWLSGAAERLPTKRFTVYFQTQSLEGLQIGSPVRMQGIRVGRVEDYTILPDRPGTVRVSLEVDRRVPVLEGVQAVISRNLLTGLAAVELTNTGTSRVPLMRVPAGETDPVIEEGVADLSRVAELVEDLGRTGHESLRRLNTLLADDNQRALAATLRNLSALTGEMRQTVPEVNATLGSARQAAERLQTTTAEVGQVAREGGAHLARVARAAELTLAEADATLQTARASLGRMEQTLDGIAVSLRLSADLASQEVEATGQSLRQAGEALQAAGRELADPRRILYGPPVEALGPGEARR
jgi:phospholipid/cholesterol/gamma-HCH transport system substrate-binding protein